MQPVKAGKTAEIKSKLTTGAMLMFSVTRHARSSHPLLLFYRCHYQHPWQAITPVTNRWNIIMYAEVSTSTSISFLNGSEQRPAAKCVLVHSEVKATLHSAKPTHVTFIHQRMVKEEGRYNFLCLVLYWAECFVLKNFFILNGGDLNPMLLPLDKQLY